MDDCQLVPFPQRLERLQAWVEPEEAVEVDRCGLGRSRTRNRDARPRPVVLALAERHDDAQAVDRAALKDGDEHLAAGGSALREGRAREKRGRETETDEGEGPVFQEDATRDHGVLLGSKGPHCYRF